MKTYIFAVKNSNVVPICIDSENYQSDVNEFRKNGYLVDEFKGVKAEDAIVAIALYKYIHDSSTSGKIVKYFAIAVLSVCALWSYGAIKAANNVDHGIPMLGAAYVAESLNPISKSGYVWYFRNFTDIVDRLNSLED